jgi:hypothetical protein
MASGTPAAIEIKMLCMPSIVGEIMKRTSSGRTLADNTRAAVLKVPSFGAIAFDNNWDVAHAMTAAMAAMMPIENIYGLDR